jgi:dTDP-4-amino-4,6-dideoxygalactose transaminase
VIALQRAWVGAEEIEELKRVFASGWLGLGPVVAEFEGAIGAYLPAKNVVATNSGTAALHLALMALDLREGDEVILPSMTFAAAVQAVLAAGAKVVFCEIDERTLNVDPEDVARRIGPRTRVVMPVHYAGLPCDMAALRSLGAQHSLRIVEDAAQAFGSSCEGKRIGSFGDITCFSFDPIKNVTCGEGGAVTTADDEVAARIRRMRLLGIDRDAYTRLNEASWYYEVVDPGLRYHLSDINAAIGIAQLRKLDRFVARRRAIVSRYDATLGRVPSLVLPTRDPGTAPFSYVVRWLGGRRDEVIQQLRKAGVGAGVHYIPNHLQPFFAHHDRVSTGGAPLPVTERVWKELLTLPLHTELTDAEVDQVVATVLRLAA